MFIMFYIFITTDWRKTDYWMILGMRFCTIGLSNGGQRKSLSTVGWEQGICRVLSILVQWTRTNAVFRLIESPKFAVGSWAAVRGGCVDVHGHADYQVRGTAKSSHGNSENSVCGAVAFPLLRSQDASYKTCLLGLVFQLKITSCVFLGVSLV